MTTTCHRSLAARSRRGNGLVLLSLLLVVGIVLYLMFGKTGSTTYMDQVKKTRDNGREMARQIRTEQMSLLIAMYRQSNSKLPKEPADLESPGAYNDGWGKEMTFSFSEQAGKTQVKYHSAGPDGTMGNDDDVDYNDVIPY
jgi:hypothetical protein